MSEEVVVTEDVLDSLPEDPESITEVANAQEAVNSLDDLWNNLVYQHREKFKTYAEQQESISAMSFERSETRVDFTKMNALRDELVKIEGGLETINLYRTLVLGEESRPWVESEIQERKKIKVRTRPGYEKYTDWESDQTATDTELNKTK